MTKVYDIDSLSNEITSDFNWRLKEISQIRKAIEKADTLTAAPLSRAAVAILYAHWEGNVRFSSEKYLEYISYKRLKFKELRSNFLYIANRARLNRLEAANNSLNEKMSILMEIVHSLEETNRSVPEKAIHTRSNLNFGTFSEICNVIGIDWSRYEGEKEFIDKMILARRNHIAHGNSLKIDSTEFHNHSKRVLGLLRWFRNDIENAALNQDFKVAV